MEDKATTEDNLREVWRVVYEICRQTNGRLATDRQTDTCTPTLIAILRITTGNETRYRPGAARRYAPRRWQYDGSKNRGGSTSVRRRVRSPHISGGRRAVAKLQAASVPIASSAAPWDRQTGVRIVVSLNARPP